MLEADSHPGETKLLVRRGSIEVRSSHSTPIVVD
jgi:hypothetical protein